MLSFLNQITCPLRDDTILISGSINPHHHHHQDHPPPPSFSQNYHSPSRSSPASSNNDHPLPISCSAATSGPPPPHHLNSFGNPCPVLHPPSSPKLSSYGSTTEARVFSPVSLHGAIAHDTSVEDTSVTSFLGKIKAFEMMDHFARAQRMLELQDAHNAGVGSARCLNGQQSETFVLLYFKGLLYT